LWWQYVQWGKGTWPQTSNESDLRPMLLTHLLDHSFMHKAQAVAVKRIYVTSIHCCFSQNTQFQTNSDNFRFLCKKKLIWKDFKSKFFAYQFVRLSAKCKMSIFCCCLVLPTHIPTPATFPHVSHFSHCPFTDNGWCSHCIHKAGGL
jgi:hypothetical protein